MDYLSGGGRGGGVLGAATSTVAGVMILPNTGESLVLMLVGIAASVTGVTLLLLQAGVWLHKRSHTN